MTLGSPLAAPMAFDSLEPPPRSTGGACGPARSERWVNVRALHDKAAAVSLVEKFGPRVEEYLIDNGHRADVPEPYLNAVATGAAIAEALGSPPTAKPTPAGGRVLQSHPACRFEYACVERVDELEHLGLHAVQASAVVPGGHRDPHHDPQEQSHRTS